MNCFKCGRELPEPMNTTSLRSYCPCLSAPKSPGTATEQDTFGNNEQSRQVATAKGAAARAAGYPKDTAHGYAGRNRKAWEFGWQYCNDCLREPGYRPTAQTPPEAHETPTEQARAEQWLRAQPGIMDDWDDHGGYFEPVVGATADNGEWRSIAKMCVGRNGDNDAPLVAALRNAAPRLLAELRTLREIVKELAACPPKCVCGDDNMADLVLRGAGGQPPMSQPFIFNLVLWGSTSRVPTPDRHGDTESNK